MTGMDARSSRFALSDQRIDAVSQSVIVCRRGRDGSRASAEGCVGAGRIIPLGGNLSGDDGYMASKPLG